MKRIFVAGMVAGLVGIAVSADYTPVTRESGSGPNAYGALTQTSTDLTITNGQVITLGAYPIIVLDANSQASATTTNTIAAAAASRVGQTYVIVNASSGTNGIIIADSAPVYGTGATLGARDTLILWVKATNEIIQLATSNN